MSLKENVSDKRTTIPGMIIIFVALAIWALSFFIELQREVNDFVLLAAGVVGAVLILSPKSVVDAFNKRTNKD